MLRQPNPRLRLRRNRFIEPHEAVKTVGSAGNVGGNATTLQTSCGWWNGTLGAAAGTADGVGALVAGAIAIARTMPAHGATRSVRAS